MSRIIRVIIQDSLHQNKNREEVNNREIRYLPDLSIDNLLSLYCEKKPGIKKTKKKPGIKTNEKKPGIKK